LVIILRGWPREEFKELQKFKETNRLLFSSERIVPVSEPDCRRFILGLLELLQLLELLELLEYLLIRGPCVKPATEGEPCLASEVHDGLSSNSQETSDLLIL
jgi:hypothetical protein